MPLLTIGLTHYSDYAGAWATLMDLFVHQKENLNDCEFVIVDNNPGSSDGKDLRDFVRYSMINWPCVRSRYIPYSKKQGISAARNEVFNQAEGEYILCLDCHVILEPNGVDHLLDYLTLKLKPRDLITGPAVMADCKTIETHQAKQWSTWGYGVWRSTDDLEERTWPFEIEQSGLAVFCSSKESFPGFHPDAKGFGCVESVFCEKYRRNGNKVLCLPQLKWYHRYEKHSKKPYGVRDYEVARNHILEFRSVDWDIQTVINHFAPRLNQNEKKSLETEFGISFS